MVVVVEREVVLLVVVEDDKVVPGLHCDPALPRGDVKPRVRSGTKR